ncbi:hypothetical protein [Lysinibacillus sp. Ag94]|uniref:hypothetical protein n=1 Tax=Lysinibacillus sp. Ag94 TaxID=2936682 RepID=UPI0020102C0D|nr:hypothetical protein [Lysinibacillus sp. Ag94]UPW83056.1 hypothetical protein MY533_20565 [Lysinibacillus sp. Ag94]
MNFTKGIKGLALTTALIGGISFLPNSAGAETLGWSEDTGYVNGVNENENENTMNSPSFYAAASSTPDSHTATKEYRSQSSPDTERVKATTKWKGVEHYSRARYENAFGTVTADSGRSYGVGISTATSGWIDKSLSTYVAKTYWGI